METLDLSQKPEAMHVQTRTSSVLKQCLHVASLLSLVTGAFTDLTDSYLIQFKGRLVTGSSPPRFSFPGLWGFCT